MTAIAPAITLIARTSGPGGELDFTRQHDIAGGFVFVLEHRRWGVLWQRWIFTRLSWWACARWQLSEYYVEHGHF